MSTLIEVNHNKSEPDDDAGSIEVNHNKSAVDADTDSIEVNHNKLLEEDAARRLRLSRRGRKPGWGKKHAAGSKPKTFKYFPKRADSLLKKFKLLSAEFMALSDAEVMERALIEYGRILVRRHGNRNPTMTAVIKRALPEPDDE